MNVKHGFISTREYFDDLNFPYGFRKSGDFIIPEANMLSAIGLRLSQLDRQQVEPENETEQQFLKVCQGLKEASTPAERLWLKYKSLVSHRHEFHGLNNSKPEVEEDYSDDDL